MDISVTVCLCVCTVTDFSAGDKASGVKFCTAVHRRLRQGMSHFCELCSPKSPKSDESASAQSSPPACRRKVTVTVEMRRRKRRDRDVPFVKSRGMWTYDRHVWIYVGPRRRTYL